MFPVRSVDLKEYGIPLLLIPKSNSCPKETANANNGYVTVEEVIAINVAMIQRYNPSEQKGVKEAKLLESAVLRPQSSAFKKDAYQTISTNQLYCLSH